MLTFQLFCYLEALLQSLKKKKKALLQNINQFNVGIENFNKIYDYLLEKELDMFGEDQRYEVVVHGAPV